MHLCACLRVYFVLKTMKLLITGASGLLGINLALEAMRAHEVIGMDRGRLKSTPFQVFKADPLDESAIDSVLDSTQPDWMVNCAALANLEECEQYPGRAQLINTDMPGKLAKICGQRRIRFVHISTDAVLMVRRRIHTRRKMKQIHSEHIHKPNFMANAQCSVPTLKRSSPVSTFMVGA
jgi:nucleoside-diphosphate-sugar epimerase